MCACQEKALWAHVLAFYCLARETIPFGRNTLRLTRLEVPGVLLENGQQGIGKVNLRGQVEELVYKFLAALVFLMAVFFGLWWMPEGKWAQLDETRSSIRAAAGEDYRWLLGSPKNTTRKAEKKKKRKKVAKTDKAEKKKKRKKMAKADGAEMAKESKANVVAVVSPDGRYVDAAMPAKSTTAATSVTIAEVVRVESPLGRYVNAVVEDAPMVVADIVRIGSPSGRYIDPPKQRKKVKKNRKRKKKVRVAGNYERIGSPAGRYVNAPGRTVEKATVTRSLVRVSSPKGRYVSAPKQDVKKKKVARKIIRVSSPRGRYVSAPTRKVKKTTVARKIVRISSPDGRYVSAPKAKRKKRRGILARVSSPDGRYVSAPAAVTTARKTESGALAFPIQFIFATSDFTSDGRKAADELLEYVKSKGFSRITLSGHTDSIGTRSDNLRLSKRRLDAVSSHLRAGGYTGEINLLPKGESEPFTGIDRSKYSRNALREFDRRVELRAGS